MEAPVAPLAMLVAETAWGHLVDVHPNDAAVALLPRACRCGCGPHGLVSGLSGCGIVLEAEAAASSAASAAAASILEAEAASAPAATASTASAEVAGPSEPQRLQQRPRPKR